MFDEARLSSQQRVYRVPSGDLAHRALPDRLASVRASRFHLGCNSVRFGTDPRKCDVVARRYA